MVACLNARVSANKKACQRYKQEYSTFWKCLQASTKGETYVRCVTCQIDFSCAHGGRFDCKRHYRDTTKNKSMTDFCINSSQANKSAETRKRNQTKAELMLCTILAQNNLSFSTAPLLTSAFKEMFLDSTIAGM